MGGSLKGKSNPSQRGYFHLFVQGRPGLTGLKGESGDAAGLPVSQTPEQIKYHVKETMGIEGIYTL